MSRFALWLALLVPVFCFADVVTLTPHDTAVKEGQNWVLLKEYTFTQDSFAQNCPIDKNVSHKKTMQVVKRAGIISADPGIPGRLIPLAVSAGGKPIVASTEPLITHSGFGWLTKNVSTLKKMIRFDLAKLKVANASDEFSLPNSKTDGILLAYAAVIVILSLIFIFAPKKNNSWLPLFKILTLISIAFFFFFNGTPVPLILLIWSYTFAPILKSVLVLLFIIAVIFFIVAFVNRRSIKAALRLALIAAIIELSVIIGLVTSDFQAPFAYLLFFFVILILFAVILGITRWIIKLFSRKKRRVPPKAAAAKEEAPKKAETKEQKPQ
jgi:hypothetical protein